MQSHEIQTLADWENQVVKSNVPVIVDFYADWCGPCKQLKPVLEEAANNAGGKWVLVKVCVDNAELNEVSGKYAGEGIPAVYLWKGGKVDSQFLGNDKSKAQAMIQKAAS